MKKLITLILLTVLAVPAFASEPVEQNWTVRTSAAYFPTLPTVASIFGAVIIGIAISSANDDETLEITIPPYFSVDVLYNFNSRWSVGLSTGYNGCIWSAVDKDTRAVHSSEYLTLIPICAVGRFNYVSRPKFKMYGSIEAGALLSAGNDFGINATGQINPMGFEFGDRFFGLLEAGFGFNYIGSRIGVGYRF